MSELKVNTLSTVDGSRSVDVADLVDFQAVVQNYVLVTADGTVKGDGVTDDSGAINLILQNMNGGTLVFPAGVYLVNNYIKLPSNTTIHLDGGATVLRGVSTLDSIFINDADGVTGGYTANANIHIQGSGIIDGNTDFLASSCTLVSFGHCTNVSVTGVNLLNIGGRWHAIEFNSTYQGVARDLYISNSGVPTDNYNEAIQIDNMATSGKFPWFGPYDNTHCQHILIDNCVINNVGTGVGSHDPATTGKHFFITIRNCRFYVNVVGVKPMNWSHVRILDNRIEKLRNDTVTPLAGIYWQYTYSGQTNSDGVISGNTITGFAPTDTSGTPGENWRGIWIDGGTTSSLYQLSNITLTNNHVYNTWGHSVVIAYADKVTITGDIIGQALGSGSTSAFNSLYMFNSTGCVFNGVRTDSPIYLGGGSITGNTVVCNNCYTTSNLYYNNLNITHGVIACNRVGGSKPTDVNTTALFIGNNVNG